jgi:hypothetical protein
MQWFQTCAQNHRCCAELSDRSIYRPARLIDLGVDFDFKRARLVETTPGDYNVDYMCLSYAWGTCMPEAGKTYLASLEEHKVRLKRAKLPKTFKHFFEIAKWFSIRYVWIDSLCMIQDDPDDWQREAAAMGMIFAGAVCTIAAESANHCQGGIWLESRLRMMNGGISPTLSPTYEDMTQEDNLKNYLSVCDQRFHKSPLQTRGWPLVEREASHRILHFTFAHIFWECREAKMHSPVLLGDSDTFVGSQAGIRESNLEWKMTRLRMFDIPLELRAEPHSAQWQKLQAISPSLITHHSGDHASAMKLLLAWRTVIEDFSGRNFSVWSDRLPSLWGMVFGLQSRLAAEHQAAIWGADPKGLLWAVQDSVAPHLRVRDITSPSWSWAAFCNPITYHHVHDILDHAEEYTTGTAARIITLGTDFWGNNPSGRSSYSGLSLNCRVRWVSSIDDFKETRYGFFREDSLSMPMFNYAASNRVLLARVLVCLGGKGTFALALMPRKDSLETVFERVGIVGGIDNRWFDLGFDKAVTIV